jgi:thioredoxin-related protein
MRTTLFVLSVALLTLVVLPQSSRASIETAAAASSIPETWELLVEEAQYCIYCDLFRRDVLPAYEASEQGKQMPVRFIDVNDLDNAHLDLKSPVDIAPTFIVLKSQHEIGRIPGYVGPENFFHSINYLLAAAP